MPREYKKLLFDIKTAIERELEIIGEAAKRLRDEFPEVAEQISGLDKIIGFRNILAHGYDVISNEIVWKILEIHLPVLKKETSHLLFINVRIDFNPDI
jgi:uncharacterized protein with HEPN domain